METEFITAAALSEGRQILTKAFDQAFGQRLQKMREQGIEKLEFDKIHYTAINDNEDITGVWSNGRIVYESIVEAGTFYALFDTISLDTMFDLIRNIDIYLN